MHGQNIHYVATLIFIDHLLQFLRQTITFQYPMAAILENGGHIEIVRGPRYFLDSDTHRVFVPNLLLVS